MVSKARIDLEELLVHQVAEFYNWKLPKTALHRPQLFLPFPVTFSMNNTG